MINIIPIGPAIHSARHNSEHTNNRIVKPVIDVVSTTESDKNNKQRKSFKYDEFDTNRYQTQHGVLSSVSSTHFRSNLLSQIYSDMSGLDPRIKPGSFIEYYA